MRTESRARARALQALYAWDMRDNEPLDRVAERIWDDLAVAPDERHFAGTLVRTFLKLGDSIDRQLADVTTNWRLSRLGAIERSVLRLAAAELSQGTTPPLVVIKESMRLAERYGTPESARFVSNGVLDAYDSPTGATVAVADPRRQLAGSRESARGWCGAAPTRSVWSHRTDGARRPRAVQWIPRCPTREVVLDHIQVYRVGSRFTFPLYARRAYHHLD